MRQQFSFFIFTRLTILTTGLLIFATQVRLAEFGQIWLPIFIVLIALVRLAEVELPQGDKVTLAACVVVAAVLLFDLPSALTIAVAGMLVATFSRQTKADLGGPLYLVAQRAIVVTTAAWWTNGRFVTAVAAPNQLELLGFDLVRALGLCVTFFLLEIALNQFALSQRQAAPFVPAFLGSPHPTAP